MNINRFLNIAFVAVLFFSSINSFAQIVITEKHLKDAVPINENGKVEFNREININKSISANQLFFLVENWANERYKPTNNQDKRRIVWKSLEENKLIALGEDKLIFKSNVLALDQSIMEYRLTIKTERGKCLLNFSNIKYQYQDLNKNEKAEDIITDKFAYNSSKNKLNKFYDKFRVFTINQVDLITEELTKYLSTLSINDVTTDQAQKIKGNNSLIVNDDAISIIDKEAKKEVSSIPTMKLTQTNFNGYKDLDTKSIPKNYSSMISQSKVIITSIINGKPTYLLADWIASDNTIHLPIALTSAYAKSSDFEGSILNNYIINFVNDIIYKDLLNKFEESDFSASQIIISQNLIAISDAWLIVECIDGELVDNFENNEKAISNKWNVNETKYNIKGSIDKIWVK